MNGLREAPIRWDTCHERKELVSLFLEKRTDVDS